MRVRPGRSGWAEGERCGWRRLVVVCLEPVESELVVLRAVASFPRGRAADRKRVAYWKRLAQYRVERVLWWWNVHASRL